MIYSDGLSDIGVGMFGAVSRDCCDYVRDKVTSFAKTVGSRANEFITLRGESLIDRVESYTKGINKMRADRQRDNMGNSFKREGIYSINKRKDITNAIGDMRHWIMACPELAKADSLGLTENWEGEFEAEHKGIGKKNYLYRRVMDQVVVDGKSESYHEVINDDDVLDLFKKRSIINTWDFLRNAMRDDNVDPTSFYNSKLK